MKRSILFIVAICILITNPVNGQGLLKKVTKSMTDELLGRPQNKNASQPEPECACSDAVLIADMGGKIQLDYSELDINVREDGAILFKDKISGNFYIAKEGVTQGPIPAGDKRLTGFGVSRETEGSDIDWTNLYGQYITRSGEKYLISFAGKTYGPYAMINSFVVSRSKDKFAATVTENLAATKSDGEKMEEAINNAKTEQEKIDLAMKFSQQMSQKMMQGGGPTSILPKFITNVEGSTYDPMMGQRVLNTEMKYDEILLLTYPDVFDLKGNKIISLKTEHLGSNGIFINSANTKYAYVSYGELMFSDNSKKLNGLFNPYLMKSDGKVHLAYMYYSPKKNAIMQCKIPF
ncbi:MAG: hypothetical protein IPH69_03920 [Bacteroidales bacterium]|nr:hypothetical protein [Bacteroidales bacterium]